ncbi:hypothetical protein P9112_008026 [Eukaryota sp. TZLM1-RC]
MASTISSTVSIRGSHSNAHRLETLLFKFILDTQSLKSRYNILSIINWILPLLQIIGFTGRIVSFPSFLDIQPILNLTSLPFYDDFTSVKASFVLIGVSLLVLFTVSITALLAFTSFAAKTSLFVRFLYKPLHESLSGFLFFPCLAFLVSFLPCTVRSTSELSFTPNVFDIQCASLPSVALRAWCILVIGILLFLKYTHICTIDDYQFTKNIIAVSNSSTIMHYTLSQVLIVAFFFLFHHRYWEFRVLYLLCSVYISVLVYKHLPFVNPRVNVLALSGLGVWVGSALGFFIYSIVFQFTEPSIYFNVSLFYSICLVFGVVFGVFTHLRLIRLETQLDELQSALESAEVVSEDGTLANSIDISQFDLSSFNLNSPSSIDAYSRCIGVKERELKNSAALSCLYHHADSFFGHSIRFVFLKTRFELNIIKEHLSAGVSLNCLKEFIEDFSFYHRFLLFKYSQILDTLRRAQSTGMNVDSTMFLQQQHMTKEVQALHKETLEGLFAFWSTLSTDTVDLSRLPNILGGVQKSKTKLNDLLSKMMQQHGEQKFLLESYAAYLKEIECDDERSAFILEQVSLLSNSERTSAVGSSVGSIGQSLSGKPKEKSRVRSRRLGVLQAGNTTKTSKSAIVSLKFAVNLALLIMFALSLVSWFISSLFLQQTHDSFVQLYEGVHVDSSSQLQGLYLLRSLVDGVSGGEQLRFGRMVAKEAEHLNFHLRRLVFLDDPGVSSSACERTTHDFAPSSETLREYFIEPNLASFTVHDYIPIQESSRVLSFWTLGLRHSQLSAVASTELELNSDLPFSSIRTILLSSQTVFSAVRSFYDFVVGNFEYDASWSIIFQAIAAVVIFAIIAVIGFGFFARSFSKISDERNGILNLFLYIPKNEVNRILSDEKFYFLTRKRKHHRIAEENLNEFVESESDHDAIKPVNNLVSPLYVDIPTSSEVTDPQPINQSNHKSVSAGSNILYVASFLMSTIVLVLVVVLCSRVDDSVSDITSAFDLSCSVRSRAADATITHRLISTYIHYYSGFGDPFFLNAYSELSNSGYVESAIQEILHMNLANDELSAIAQGNTHLNEIHYLEQISVFLLSHVFDFPDEVLHDAGDFQYNISTETVAFKRKLEFPEVDPWYSNHYDDSQLSKDEMQTLAQHTINSPRWMNINSRFMAALEGVPNSVIDSRMEEITNTVVDVNFNLRVILVLIAISALLFLLGVFVFVKVLISKRLRFGKGFLILLSILISLGFAASAFSSLNTSSYFHSLDDLTQEGIDLFTFIIQTEHLFHGIKRTPQVMAYENFDYTLRFSGRLDQLNDNMDILNEQSLCKLEKTSSLCQTIATQTSQISDLLEPIMERIMISARLKHSSMDIDSYNLSHITWTEDSTSDASWELPNGLYLTNDEDDLALDSEQKRLLSMALLSSRSYEEMTSTVADVFGELRHSTLTTLRELLNTEVNQINLFSSIVVYLAYSIMISVGVCIITFLIGGSKKREELSFVQQRVKISSVSRFTRHYRNALIGLSFVLLCFYLLCIYGFYSLASYPQYFANLGQRSSLISSTCAHLAESCAIPSSHERANRDAFTSSSDLIEKHNELIPGLLRSGSDQTALLFNTAFDDDQRYFFFKNMTDKENVHGLHSLLIYFVESVEKFSGKEQGIDHSCSGNTFHHILDAGSLLAELAMDSIDHFFTYISSERQFFNTILLVIFVVFVVVLFFCYTLVFRTMLSTLREEEETTVSFLDMLSDHIVEQSVLLRKYMAEAEI